MASFFQSARQKLRKVQRYNLQTFRSQPLREISGSVGDFGTLLPILIALSDGKVSLPSTLVFSGIANILTGACFGIPLPVQPMKAIAAVALARDFDQYEVASAGLLVAGVVGFLSVSGLIHWFTHRIPIPVVKGIQVATGLSLVIYGGKLIEMHFGHQPQNNVLPVLTVLIAFLALLASPMFPQIPFALLILFVGMLTASGWLDTDPPFGLGVWKPHAFIPSWASFRTGAWEAGIGQIPLTTLNSVIAVSFLSADLLPKVQAPSTTEMGLSVMAVNMVGCWFGAMPICHGSGGLAAQYRFGARSGASIIFLGLVKLILGVFAGNFTQNLFAAFPRNLLSIMVIASGLELANVGESLNTAGARDLKGPDQGDRTGEIAAQQRGLKRADELTEPEMKRRWAVMLITIGAILAFRNDAVGFLAGMFCHWSFMLQDYLDARRTRREGHIRLPSNSQAENSLILRHEDA